MKKKIKVTIMLFALVETIMIGMFSNNVYARDYMDKIVTEEDKGNIEEKLGMHDGAEFVKEKDKYEFISQKIEEEKKKHTGRLDTKHENKLNEYGILDEEIEALNEEDISMIQSTSVDELVIMTSIYACEDTDDSDLSEMIELSNEQIDKLYAQEYYGETTDLDLELQNIYDSFESKEENIEGDNEIAKASIESVDRETSKCSMMDILDNSVSTAQNIEVMNGTTTALSSTTSSYFETNQSSYLKKTLYARIDKTKKTISVTFSTVWIKMPDNRNMDVIWLDWEGMYYTEGNKCKVTHKVKEEYGTYSGKIYDGAVINVKTISTKWLTTECKRAAKSTDLYGSFTSPVKSPITVSSETYDVGTRGMCIFTSMHNTVNIEKYTYTSGMYVEGEAYHYKDESIIVELVLNLNTGMQTQVFGCIYYHYYFKKEEEYDYSAITSAVLTIGGCLVDFNKVGFAIGVIDAINDLSTTKIVTVTNKLTYNQSGCGFRPTLVFRYK